MSLRCGFSLIELLITVAIVGIVSAAALPAYRAYVDTARMSKVNAAYENAIRMAQQEFAKRTTQATLGMISEFPSDDDAFIEILNPGNAIEAPGGGPAYVKNKKKYGNPDETGAVLVRVNKDGTRITVFRPAYLTLTPLRARITPDEVKIKEL